MAPARATRLKTSSGPARWLLSAGMGNASTPREWDTLGIPPADCRATSVVRFEHTIWCIWEIICPTQLSASGRSKWLSICTVLPSRRRGVYRRVSRQYGRAGPRRTGEPKNVRGFGFAAPRERRPESASGMGCVGRPCNIGWSPLRKVCRTNGCIPPRCRAGSVRYSTNSNSAAGT